VKKESASQHVTGNLMFTFFTFEEIVPGVPVRKEKRYQFSERRRAFPRQ
jgi:hypothetical protein